MDKGRLQKLYRGVLSVGYVDDTNVGGIASGWGISVSAGLR